MKQLFVRLLTIVLIVSGLSLLLYRVSAAHFETPAEAIDWGVKWLVESHQNSDGGFSSFSSGRDVAPSDIGGTVDGLMALGSSGRNSHAPLAYLEAHPEELTVYAAQNGGTAGKLILALAAADQDARAFAGQDFVIQLTNHLSPTGQFGVTDTFNQSLAILALAAVEEPIPAGSVTWLLSQQATTGDVAGSWDDGYGTAGNPDATAMAILALQAAGRPNDDPAIVAAVEFLRRVQLPLSGWEYGTGFGENPNSIALSLHALQTVGQVVNKPDSPWAKDGLTPLRLFLSWQADNGAFQADFGSGRVDDFFTTTQALPVVALFAEPVNRGFNPLMAWILIALALVGAISLRLSAKWQVRSGK